MRTLYIDTETTGKPVKRAGFDHPGQPHLVQLAAILAVGDRVVGAFNMIVKPPDGVSIPQEVVDVHGIDDETAAKFGVSLNMAVSVFANVAAIADRLVAHSIDFDRTIMGAAFARMGRATPWMKLPAVCTMRSGAHVFKEPSRWPKPDDPYAWPSLDKTYRRLVDEAGFEGAHDAMADVRACFKIMRALEDGGHLLVGGKGRY